MPTDLTGDPGFAPAKINLTLHVTGRRADGYHLLDSLVVFAGIGDRVAAASARDLTLRVIGPEAQALSGEADNLVLRAAHALGPYGAAITLEKNLPVASGIGGGSSDAGAALRVLSRLWDRRLPGPDEVLALGADVPACLDPRPCRMRGVGEVLAAVPRLPPAWLVLANPRRALATSAVFRALGRPDNPPMPDIIPEFAGVADFAAFVARGRNDLEAPAITVEPLIALTRDAVAATEGCLVARMSGSGATCFGLYADGPAARAAAARLSTDHPGWWTTAAPILHT